MDTEKSQDLKYRLAAALKQCMSNNKVENITVKQIVSTCGVSRQSFYRNFIDKYDLINWYFDRLLDLSFQAMSEGENIRSGLCRKFAYIRAEKVFFAAAFRVDEQNNLKEHDFSAIQNFYRHLIRSRSNEELTARDDKLLELYCQMSIYMTVQWVLHGMVMSDIELADLLIDAMPPRIHELFLRLEIL